LITSSCCPPLLIVDNLPGRTKMKVVTTFSPSSSVLSSTRCKLNANSDLEFLVVGKLDRLEVYSLQLGGLKLECGLGIWGRIVAVKALPVDVRSSLATLFGVE